MQWLSKIDGFSPCLQSISSLEPGAQKIEKLRGWRATGSAISETLQLDRALAATISAGAEGFVPLRVAVIGSATLQQLAIEIRVAGLRYRFLFDVRSGGYGQYRQEVLTPTSFLHSFAPQIVLLSLTAKDVLANIPLTATAQDVDAALTNAIDELRNLWRSIRSNELRSSSRAFSITACRFLAVSTGRPLPRRAGWCRGSTSSWPSPQRKMAWRCSTLPLRRNATASMPGSISGIGCSRSRKSDRGRGLYGESFGPRRRAARPLAQVPGVRPSAIPLGGSSATTASKESCSARLRPKAKLFSSCRIMRCN